MLNNLTEQIADRLLDIFDKVIDDRRRYFLYNPAKIPLSSAVTEIIEDYTTKNALIAGALNLIPGPLGVLTLPTEITTVIYNQVAMIYDLGVAHGRQDSLTKELLLGVLLSALGMGAGNVLVAQGSAYVVHRLSSDAIEHLIRNVLAWEIAETFGKSVAGKFIPVVGAVAIGAYVSYTTQRIGKRAVEVFQHEIKVSGILQRDDLEGLGVGLGDLWETDEAVWQELERKAGFKSDLTVNKPEPEEIYPKIQAHVPIPPILPPVVLMGELVEDDNSNDRSRNRDRPQRWEAQEAYESSYSRYEEELAPLEVNFGLNDFKTDESVWLELEQGAAEGATSAPTPPAPLPYVAHPSRSTPRQPVPHQTPRSQPIHYGTVRPLESLPTTADFEKLKCLINLMKADGVTHGAEKVFIREILGKSKLSQEQIKVLQGGLKSSAPLPVEYGPFRESWHDRIALLMDLVALAKRDGEIHPAEKAYILEVSANVGLKKGEISLIFRA